MKVVVTTDCFLPRWDGIARFLSVLLPEFSKSMEVVVFAPEFPGDLPKSNATIIRFPLINVQFGDICFSKPNKKSMAEHIRSADIVFNQTIGPIGRAGILLAKKAKKPVITYVHSIEWELAYRAVKHLKWLAEWIVKLRARRLYNNCSLIAVPSAKVAGVLSENKIKTTKEIIPLGVLTSKFVPPKSKAKAKEQLGISKNKLVVGFCGRIAREKDLPTLYRAFKQIEVLLPNVVLLIVGEGLEEEIPPRENIIRVGRQDNVVPFLQAMDVFVMPSLTETSSFATMEAMSTGLAVIATPVGSIPEYIHDTENGLLFICGDVEDLREKIVLLLKNAKKRKQLGAAARKSMIEAYSWDKTVNALKDVLIRFSSLPR